MSEQDEKTGKPKGFFRRAWHIVRSPTGSWSLGGLLVFGFASGILFWGGFHWALELTNTEKFCISCHEMERNFVEYKETVHYNNHSGVRATCPDCHVPKEWQHKIVAKILASKDVYHTLMGTIDTPEKYDAHRLHMASLSWVKMKKSDSRECRNCHNFEYMDFTIQENRAAAQHQQALDEGKTCIDCHQGVAHNLPAGYLEKYKEVTKDLEIEAKSSPVQDRAIATAGAEIENYLTRN
ncbi:NapC/NirT family cytochrome c [Shimia sp. R11_0]|uniref:NapC/NirT family cytochrome c n=1 Tax=Shimia sp. R11_0 TaxID=2821096 RepID=UPI001AD9AF19|nr:NapC/NirT family cytochrome c [Shimia sp. R11_0]MBO9477037.1 NapC/NirT family cytochrome c [Shimia sp. R11_0]